MPWYSTDLSELLAPNTERQCTLGHNTIPIRVKFAKTAGITTDLFSLGGCEEKEDDFTKEKEGRGVLGGTGEGPSSPPPSPPR